MFQQGHGGGCKGLQEDPEEGEIQLQGASPAANQISPDRQGEGRAGGGVGCHGQGGSEEVLQGEHLHRHHGWWEPVKVRLHQALQEEDERGAYRAFGRSTFCHYICSLIFCKPENLSKREKSILGLVVDSHL